MDMNKYDIAGILVEMDPKEITLIKQSKAYKCNTKSQADIKINIKKEFLQEKQKQNPHLTIDECEYIWTGAEFYNTIIAFGGFMLHASAVAFDGKAYLFSANSGTGKSTHTALWQKYFGEERAQIINDDKPAITLIEDKFYACGTPWSGKTDKNLPKIVPLASIIFMERSEINWIRRIDSKESIKLTLQQTLRPKDIEKMDKLLVLIDKLLKTIPIYKMGCNMSEEAVKLAYNKLKTEE